MRLSRAALPLLTLSLVLAACSASTTGGTPQASAQAPTPAASAAASPSAAAGGVTVNLADSTLGKVLADGTGKTLYVFTPDAAAAGKSVCNGDCATNWPPLLSDAAPTPGTGLDAEDFTTIARDDGTKQVAFYGHPLYFFAGDKAAGDTTGQGVGGKWYAVGADGNMIGAEAASPSAAASGGVSVALADNALGKILVGDNGMTLYLFTPDRAASPSATATARPTGRRSSPTRRPRWAPGLTRRTSRPSSATTARARSPSTAIPCTTSPPTRPRATPTARASAGSGTCSTAKGTPSSSQPPAPRGGPRQSPDPAETIRARRVTR